MTDARGKFTVRFGKFRCYDQATGHLRPGFGEFYLVVSKPGAAGGVSRCIENWKEGEDKSDWGWYPNEWYSSKERPDIRLADHDNPFIHVILKRGATISGRVANVAGKPVAGFPVGISCDLHVGTHTGRGGEIFERQTTSDANGRFMLSHVYPNRFYALDYDGGDAGTHWLRTRVNGGDWVRHVGDEVNLGSGFQRATMDVRVGSEWPYRYFGKVTDGKGRPVAGARIDLTPSGHWPPETWEDNHWWEKTISRKDGSWEVRLSTPYVRWLMCSPAGSSLPGKESDQIFPADDVTPNGPGRYDLTLP